MLLLNILPCVCLTTLNKRIYDVVQMKIQNMVSLNKRKVGAVPQIYSAFLISTTNYIY